MEALATKYRPRTFKDVVCQDNVKRVLVNQLETNQLKQAYLFTGSAGTGKTTSARILANDANEGKGKPIEIDGASNNGVDNIRVIIDDCRMKSLNSKYKIYIIDECHMLSTGAWNAFLKVLEEPPKGVIFILCTTDPQKIPSTILSRVQRFDFKRIPQQDIVDRLEYILKEEGILTYNVDAIEYIAKLADGGMRDAIMKLDTVLGYTNEINMDNTLACLGVTSYDDMFKIVNSIIDRDATTAINVVERIFKDGKDLKLFTKDLGKCLLDLCKYNLTKTFDATMIPPYMQRQAIKLASLNIADLVDILDGVNKIQDKIKYEQYPKYLLESELMLLCLL